MGNCLGGRLWQLGHRGAKSWCRYCSQALMYTITLPPPHLQKHAHVIANFCG